MRAETTCLLQSRLERSREEQIDDVIIVDVGQTADHILVSFVVVLDGRSAEGTKHLAPRVVGDLLERPLFLAQRIGNHPLKGFPDASTILAGVGPEIDVGVCCDRCQVKESLEKVQTEDEKVSKV